MILIVGDLILDETHWVDVHKISPEAPVPVAYLKNKFKRTLGGAGLAATYAHKHDFTYRFYTFGQQYDDYTGDNILGPVSQYSVVEWAEGNIIKTRYIDEATRYHLLRVDNDKEMFDRYISLDYEVVMDEAAECGCNIIMMMDYDKGIFDCEEDVQGLIKRAKDVGCFTTYADTRSEDIEKFKGVDILKLNDKEHARAMKRFGMELATDFYDFMEVDSLIITRAREGAEIRTPKGTAEFCPNLKKYNGVPDVTGCGDVFDVNYCNCLSKMLPFNDCLKIAVDKATEFAYEPMETRLCLT